MSKISAVIASFRPRQWTKNCFIFAGLLFSQNLFHLQMLAQAAFAGVIFCLLSGCVYVINDLVDLEQDKQHPVKSRRPIASGALKVSTAKFVVIILLPLCLVVALLLNTPFFIVAAAYLLVQIAYSFLLKHIVILDVFAIAAGFVLRVIAGAVAIQVEISSWLIVCTVLLALFLALSKRRHELIMLEHGAENHRKVLKEYSPYFLDQMIAVVTASTVVCYALYTKSVETVTKFGTRNLVFTVPFVLYGIFRYQYLVHQKGQGGNPEDILINDKPLLVNVVLWAIAAGIVLYGNKL